MIRNYKNSGAKTPTAVIDLESENKRLCAELAETKWAHEILKWHRLSSRRELAEPFEVIIDIIDQHKDELGLEPIICVLQGPRAQIDVSSYYAFRSRLPSVRGVRDEQCGTAWRSPIPPASSG